VFSFLLRRILYAVPILVGTTFLLFLIFNVVPGDPAIQIAGKHATAESIENIRRQLGLDLPWYQQYFRVLMQLATLDFGISYTEHVPIKDIILERGLVSFSLVFPPFVISILLSLGLGIFVAMNRGNWIDKWAVALCVGGQSISILVYIVLGQYFLAYKLKWFEIHGPDSFVLPGIIYVVLSLAPQVRFYRTAVLDELYQDYVRTARSKGLGTKSVMFKHVLKNAMIPIITDVVISIPFLILGALLLEAYFGVPGLGNFIVNAIRDSDRPGLVAITFVGTALYIVFNLISDVLYAVVDPRVQFK
jgi:peptide/nickel transport system permease protein